MPVAQIFPNLNAVIAGNVVFSADMPVWLSTFGSDIWPFTSPEEPRSSGPTTNAIVWRDYINGRGSTFGNPNSVLKSRYECCLTQEMVGDLKIAAVIHAYFPALIKHARSSKAQLDPKTVKGRIDELIHLFSAIIQMADRKYKLSISRLQDIPLRLLKEAIAVHPGRGEHLKRALKLISDPTIQKNMSGPLQWQLVDIEKSSVRWPKSIVGPGIRTLSDSHFLFIQNQCIECICSFKKVLGLPIHFSEIKASVAVTDGGECLTYKAAVLALLKNEVDPTDFLPTFGLRIKDVELLIANAQCASIMLLLLLTGMRISETHFVMNKSLFHEHGYWFIKSKVVKGRRKDMPISEGWLAIDVVRDAYEILSFFCDISGNKHLFSSPFPRFLERAGGYGVSIINTKLSRWLSKIDTDGLFRDWKFSVHQCRETLVFQLAMQEVGLPFISMQLKHFHSRFNGMPNNVTAGYGRYRSELMTSVANRIAAAREYALGDLYDENARFGGGGGKSHKARIDTFFAGLGLFGAERKAYIGAMAKRGVKLQPTSVGNCARNFALPTEDKAPPCYGDYECDPDCDSHVITERGGQVLVARRDHARAQVHNESNPAYKVIWLGLVEKLDRHVDALGIGENDGT